MECKVVILSDRQFIATKVIIISILNPLKTNVILQLQLLFVFYPSVFMSLFFIKSCFSLVYVLVTEKPTDIASCSFLKRKLF